MSKIHLVDAKKMLVSFCLNNCEICDETYRSAPFLREVYCEIYMHCIEYLKFENTPCFERLPRANGRREVRCKDRQEAIKQIKVAVSH